MLSFIVGAIVAVALLVLGWFLGLRYYLTNWYRK